MMYLYDKQMHFANQIGFKTPAQAIIKIGKRNFLDRFKTEYSELIDDTTIKRERLKKEKKTIPVPEGGVQIKDDLERYIYPDGRMYSIRSNRFLKPIHHITNTYESYCFYSSKGIKIMIARLVYFYFGSHNYKHMDDMPKIRYKDGNSKNWDISNLIECKEPFQSNEDGKKKLGGRDVAISVMFIEDIKNMIRNKTTLVDIAKEFSVSPPTIAKYIKRHSLTEFYHEHKIT